MKLYLQFIKSFFIYYFGKLFWSKEKLKQSVMKQITDWHGEGYRFWYYYCTYGEGYNDIFILTNVKDNEIILTTLTKGTHIEINGGERKVYNPSLFHFNNVPDNAYIFKTTEILYTLTNAHHFRHYKNSIKSPSSTVNEVVNSINLKSAATATNGTFKIILDKTFNKTLIPVYNGRVCFYNKRRR